MEESRFGTSLSQILRSKGPGMFLEIDIHQIQIYHKFLLRKTVFFMRGAESIFGWVIGRNLLKKLRLLLIIKPWRIWKQERYKKRNPDYFYDAFVSMKKSYKEIKKPYEKRKR